MARETRRTPRTRTVRAIATAVAAVVASFGCASTPDAAGSPRVCRKDLDCGDHHYCSTASVCTSDCFVDTDCLGPYADSQCNTHGRCIDPVDAAPPPADTGTKAETASEAATEAGG